MPSNDKRTFRYQKRSREDIRERANARGGSFDDFIKSSFKKYKVKDGKNVIRILPPTWDEARHYGYDIWINYSIGPDNGTYLSLSKMKGDKRDPVAMAQRQAASDGDEKLAKDLRPRQRILMWVVDRMAEEEGPQLWPAPFTFDKDLANLSCDEDTKEIIEVDDPENGCDIRFYKEGTGLKTDYPSSKMKLLERGPIHQDEKVQDDWLAYIQENPAPTCLNFYDAEYISSVFEGQPAKKEEEPEPPRRAARPAAPPAAPWDENEEATPPARPAARANGTVKHEEPTEEPPRRRLRVAAPEPEPEAEAEPAARESIRDRIRRRRAETVGEED